VLPDELAGSRIESLHDGSGRLQVHDAVVRQRDSLLRAGALGDRPGQFELAHVGLIDLLQRRETLRIVGAVEHQPVVGAGILQVILNRERGDRLGEEAARSGRRRSGRRNYRSVMN